MLLLLRIVALLYSHEELELFSIYTATSPKCLSKAYFKFYTNESGTGSSLPQNVRTNKLYELSATIYFSYYISLGFNAGATRRCHFKKLVKNLAKKYHTFLASESVIKQIPFSWVLVSTK
ncbi:hypothetical protein V6N11_008520 [Hibiscus sabdariffa]